WMFTLMNDAYSIGYINSDNKWNSRLFNPISNDIVQAISKDMEGNILFGGSGGIHKYHRNQSFDIETPYQTIISKVSVMDDSLIYLGYWQDSTGAFTHIQPNSVTPNFHYKTNAIAFEFASPTFGSLEDIRFSYVLEGNNDKWSKWTHDIKKEYTNLPAGEYTFMVKAINVFETESEVAKYSFTIEKPWFQTWWYYTIQTSILLILVLLTVVLNRSGKPTAFSSIIAFVTIITVFEFVIMVVEPYLIQYTGEIPVFNLIMNILMAASLAPVEKLVRNFLARKKHD
ncbi:MAG: triple tyrosine motif-containing protein, partial [Salibacteraceae bacterium]